MKTVGMLQELGVKPGDVVECVGWTGDDSKFTVGDIYKVYDRHPSGHYDGLCAVGEHGGWAHAQAQGDIQIFRIVSCADDAPKLWRDMTNEEKGAMLLAHLDGKVIEHFSHGFGWVEDHPNFLEKCAYRIKPEPKVETVSIYGRPDVQWVLEQCKHDTHKITFTTIDGKPDCTSIKMETL